MNIQCATAGLLMLMAAETFFFFYVERQPKTIFLIFRVAIWFVHIGREWTCQKIVSIILFDLLDSDLQNRVFIIMYFKWVVWVWCTVDSFHRKDSYFITRYTSMNGDFCTFWYGCIMYLGCHTEENSKRPFWKNPKKLERSS